MGTVYCRVQWHIGKSSSGHVTSISTESHDKRRSSSSDSRIWYAHFTVTLLGAHRPRALRSPQRSPQFYIHHSHRGGLVFFPTSPVRAKQKSTCPQPWETGWENRRSLFRDALHLLILLAWQKKQTKNPECNITIKGKNLHGAIHMYTVPTTLHFESNKRSAL